MTIKGKLFGSTAPATAHYPASPHAAENREPAAWRAQQMARLYAASRGAVAA